MNFRDLRNFYHVGDAAVIGDLPEGTRSVEAQWADGSAAIAEFDDVARLQLLTPGTPVIQARDSEGRVLAEEFTTVGSHAGERPVHGFATSFGDEDVAEILEWSRATRTTVIQIYDWMASYTEPQGPGPTWLDPSRRPVSLVALRSMARGLDEMGAVAHAYAPVYAVGLGFAEDHPEMLLYHADGQAIRFLDQIVLANPANVAWQTHFVESYGSAGDNIGFGGFHVDTYGYPRIAFDAEGEPVDMTAAYESFLSVLRNSRRDDLISFNQVDGVPSAAHLPGDPQFRYCEVWAPNDRWRHFEGLLDRSSGKSGRPDPNVASREPVRGSIACYPPVWGEDDAPELMSATEREEALRTGLCTEAIVTMLGASALSFGDRGAVLRDPYYPKRVPLTVQEARRVIEWRRFSLRCRDLFIDGEDTSWVEIGDENGTVSVSCDASVRPEPDGGSLFARVTRAPGLVAVGLLDLTGSARGSWSERTSRGRLSLVRVQIHVDVPSAWRVDVAVLGVDGGRFQELVARDVPHRQGRALDLEVPLGGGWSVVRVRQRVADRWGAQTENQSQRGGEELGVDRS